MAEIWLFEFAKGIGRLFLHPIFYFSLLLTLTAGMLRVKRERKDFHIRVHDVFHELRYLFPAGIVIGLLLSVLSISVGLTMPLLLIAAIAIVTFLFGVVGNARLLSPAFTIGIALLFIFAATYFEIEIPFFNNEFESLQSPYFIGATILLGIFVIIEGILMLKNGLLDVSPKLRISRRGLTVGALQTKRLWLLPVFLFLPTGPLSAPFSWWPVMEWGNQHYSLILVPFLVGFQQQIQSTLPGIAVEKVGKQVIALGFIVLAIAACGFFYPSILPLIAVAFAIIGRIWIAYNHRVRENSAKYYFTPQNTGIMILDVIPDSPADKMGLMTGEIIQSCNQIKVRNKRELYEALLKNRAYCKLEVFDTNGEIRLLQRALYEGDHHELGILFIEEQEKNRKAKAM